MRWFSALSSQKKINRSSAVAGFTIIETLIVIVVLAVIATVVVASFNLFKEDRALEGAAEGLVSTLEQARSQTLSFKNQAIYGVHFDANQYVLFQGNVYDPAAGTNVTFHLPEEVQLSAWVLEGGGNEVIFDRLTGATSEFGTVTLSLKSRPANTKTVTILATGLVSGN